MLGGEKPVQTAEAVISNRCDAADQPTTAFPDLATSLTINHLWLADAVARVSRDAGKTSTISARSRAAACSRPHAV